MLLPFALLVVAFYFLIIRPQRNRSRAADQLQARLAPGVEIMTTSGLHGTVTEITDDTVVLEVAPGVRVTFAKAAVGRIVTEDTTPVDDADEHDAARDDLQDQAQDDADAGSRRSNAGE
jgi:preprotein translocase subunit YajC